MLKLSKTEYRKIENLIYSSARDLEIALFQHYLDGDDPLMAVHALTIYQNKDGGFGHGLEADSLNPNSSSIQTWYALKTLKELGYNHSNLDDVTRYIINKALHYIYYNSCEEDGYINATVESNNDYPCASWWKHSEKSKEEWNYNPTAYLYALTLWFTTPTNKYYKKVLSFLPKCLNHYLNSTNTDGHELVGYIDLYDVLKKKNILNDIHDSLLNKINADIDRLIATDIDKWGKEYSGSTYPLELLTHDYLINSEERKILIEKNLDYLITSRGDGLWDISWKWWNEYEEFELQRIKWRGVISVNNLKLLKQFNRIED